MPWDKRCTTCLDLICVMQDIAARLCRDEPKYDILEVCLVPEEDFDIHRVQEIAGRTTLKEMNCKLCVDPFFASLWAKRLRNNVDPATKQAHSNICDIAASVRVTSSVVEKKHLLAQESKPAKRGRAITCNKLGLLVMRKLVTRSTVLHREEALVNHLGSGAESLRKSFIQPSGLFRSAATQIEERNILGV